MKRTTNILILIASVILTMAGCKKDPVSRIYKGRVLERVTNKPIKNARISVRLCSIISGSGTLSCNEVDSLFTDAEGRCNYQIPGGADVWLWAEKQHYYEDSEGLHLVGDFGQINRDIYLDPKAWLELHMVRDAPFDERFIEVVGHKSGESPMGAYDMNTFQTYNGIYEHPGNDSTYIFWSIRYLNGTTSKFSKLVYLPGLDTTRFDLHF